MPGKKPQFPPPRKPLSYADVVNKILSDGDYAAFIHGEAVKARGGDRAAAENVFAHFMPTAKELKDLKLPRDFANQASCTAWPTHTMIDFATPAQIWRQ